MCKFYSNEKSNKINERKWMAGKEISFLDPYGTKLCIKFFWFTSICLRSAHFLFFILAPPQLFWLFTFSEFLYDTFWSLRNCVKMLTYAVQHFFTTVKTLGRMCAWGSLTSTLEVFCLWSSPSGMPGPDHRRCSSRSTVSPGTTSHKKTWVFLGHFHIPLFPETMMKVLLKAEKSALKAVRLPISRLDWWPERSSSLTHYHCSA